jgi:hypothetical protein
MACGDILLDFYFLQGQGPLSLSSHVLLTQLGLECIKGGYFSILFFPELRNEGQLDPFRVVDSSVAGMLGPRVGC